MTSARLAEDRSMPTSSVLIPALYIWTSEHSRCWRGTVVERRSLTGELSLSCARPAADG